MKFTIFPIIRTRSFPLHQQMFLYLHMALALTSGGLTRIIFDKRAGKEVSKDKTSTIAPGLAVGGSFVIPILIIRALIG